MHIEWFINSEEAEQDTAVQRLLSTGALEQVVERTLQAVGIQQPVTLSLVITDDEEIQTLNKEFRLQDKPTDVLSFPLLDEPLVSAPADQLWQAVEERGREGSNYAAHPAFIVPSGIPTNLGDIVISWPTVLRQAEQAGHHPAFELLYLLSHGTLHLVGYDDQSEAGYQAMLHLQESILQKLDWDTISK
ncbi:MAG: rRNA maturation RNase YbeY [Ktedonobacteraceae bacterium]